MYKICLVDQCNVLRGLNMQLKTEMEVYENAKEKVTMHEVIAEVLDETQATAIISIKEGDIWVLTPMPRKRHRTADKVVAEP